MATLYRICAPKNFLQSPTHLPKIGHGNKKEEAPHGAPSLFAPHQCARRNQALNGNHCRTVPSVYLRCRISRHLLDIRQVPSVNVMHLQNGSVCIVNVCVVNQPSQLLAGKAVCNVMLALDVSGGCGASLLSSAANCRLSVNLSVYPPKFGRLIVGNSGSLISGSLISGMAGREKPNCLLLFFFFASVLIPRQSIRTH